MDAALPPLTASTLYLVATPIGNLEDIRLRALRGAARKLLSVSGAVKKQRSLLMPGQKISKSACELFHDKAVFPAFQTRNPV